MSDLVKESWDNWSDTWYQKYRTDEAIFKIIDSPVSAFHNTTLSMIKEQFPDLRGKRVCVPSSGDNHAVFAFHLLGAKVTSCDISEKQLHHSSAIADKYGWDIEFICDDTMHLSNLQDHEFDLVYTSNGVHVWISDLDAMYRNIQRILKNDGIYVMFDIHPFMRPFGTSPQDILKVHKPYDVTGPFGDVPTYKWRIQDMMNAMISSNLSISRIEEMYAEDGTFWIDDSEVDLATLTQQEISKYCDWERNPLAALPQWLSIRAVKQDAN